MTRPTFALALVVALAAQLLNADLAVSAGRRFSELVKEPRLERSRECHGNEPASPSAPVGDVLFPRPQIVLNAHQGPARDAAFNSDGTMLVSGGDDGIAKVWMVGGNGAPLELRHRTAVNSVTFSPAGTRVATASGDGVSVWDLSVLPARQMLFPSDLPVSSVAFSADGFRLASAGRDGIARVWRIDGKAPSVQFRAAKSLTSVAFSPEIESSRLIAGSNDGTALVWPSDGTAEPIVLKGHDGPVRHVAFNADGTRAVTAGDNYIRVWRLDGSAKPQSFALYGHAGLVLSAAFGPAPTELFPAPIDKATATRVAKSTHWPGLPADVASAGEDGIVCVWTWDGGPPFGLEHPFRGVNSVSFSLDGTRVVTSGSNGQVIIWGMVRPQ